jgi:hypothetical protein
MWYGPTLDGSVPDPSVDNGVNVELSRRRWWGFTRGTSLYVAYFSKHDPRMREILRDNAAAGNSPGADVAALVMQDARIAGPSFENESGNGEARWRDLSYEDLDALYDRVAAMRADFADVASDEPDLSAFEAAGGKLLSWHGWNDEALPAQATMHYYDRVVERMGGLARVQQFFKLYVVPGGGHMSPQGTSNEDANPPIFAPGQFFRLLKDWVEHGFEPDRVEISSPRAEPAPITQPIYPSHRRRCMSAAIPGTRAATRARRDKCLLTLGSLARDRANLVHSRPRVDLPLC